MGELIGFLLLVGFSIFSSIAKAAKEKREAERARVRREMAAAPVERPKRQKKSVQSEIEAFLTEVTGTTAGDAGGRAGQQQQKDDQDQRERAEERRRKQEAARRRQQQLAERRRREKARNPQPSSKEKRPQPQVAAENVAAHVRHGTTAAARPAPSARSGRTSASAIFSMLQDSEGVRNAIIVNEILNRPRSLRRPTD